MIVNKFSRRNVLSGLGASGLTTAFLVGTQTIAEARSTPNIIDVWLNAFYIAKDPAALAVLYTSDGIFEEVPAGFSIQGSNNIKCFVEGALMLFDNFEIELISTFSHRKKAVAEYFLTATNTGLYPSTPEVNTLGKSFRVRAITVLNLKGNKIERSADYYDNAGILAQLGLLEPPPLPEPPTCE